MLSIVIISWNTRDLLAACLTSLRTYPPDGDHEIVVVDNASRDDSTAMVRRDFPHVHLLENPTNVGFAAANNQALALCRGRYVLLLNSDTEVTPGTLSALVSFMEQHPQAGVVAPTLVNPDGSFQASYARFPTFVSEFLLITRLARWLSGPYAPSPRPRINEPSHPVDWVAGAALLVRRAAIDQVGGLDAGYFMYSEETDWCWRLWRHNWQVWYLPAVKVIHHGGASSRQRGAASYAQLYASKVRFFERAYGPAAAGRLRTLFRLVAAARGLTWRILRFVTPSPAGRVRLQQRLAREQRLAAQLSHDPSLEFST